MKKLQIITSLVIIIFIIFNLNIHNLSKFLKIVSFYYQIPLLLIISLTIRAIRWKILFDDNYHNIHFLDSFSLLLVGVSLNIILPAGTGDIGKSYFGYKWSGIKERMFIISIFDKIIALFSASLFGIIILLFKYQIRYLILLVTSFLFFGILIYFFINNKILQLLLSKMKNTSFKNIRLFKKLSSMTLINNIIHKTTTFFKNKMHLDNLFDNSKVEIKNILFSICLSCAGWFSTYLMIYFCFLTFNLKLPLVYILWIGPVLTLIRLFPLTFNGIGSDELGWLVFFQQTGINNESILITAFLFRIVNSIIPALIGSFILFNKKNISVITKSD